jgi:hypothetical protein
MLLAAAAILTSICGWAGAQTAATTRPADANAASTVAEPTSQDLDFFSEPWFKKVKNPVPWFSWGADLRIRDEYFNNIKVYQSTKPDGSPNVTLNKNAIGHETNWGRYRTRLWTTVTPVKDVDINARLVWEFRTFSAPDMYDLRSTDLSEALFDNLNVKTKNFLGLPVTVTTGRQDIILGDGWLVLDGTPRDGSRTIYFDAIRATTEFKDANTTVDTIYIQQYAQQDKYIKPFNDEYLPMMEQNERGAILYATNKSLKDTEISPYFIYKQDTPVDYPGIVSVPADIYTFGVRVARQFDEHWQGRAEIADQLGHKNYQDLCALGFNSRLSYFVNDKLNNNFRLAYEFLSGDRPGTSSTNEQFDPLWGRWPQFSELWACLDGSEFRPGETTNLQRVGPGWSISPTPKMEFLADYYLMFANQNTFGSGPKQKPGFSDDGLFRGQLMTFLLKYKFNDHMQGHLLSEFFFPGNYYTSLKNDWATFLRAEMVFTW